MVSRPQAFQRAIDGVHTLPLSPPKGGSKSVFFIFNKSKLQLNKVCLLYTSDAADE